jgi:hypothetical protein
MKSYSLGSGLAGSSLWASGSRSHGRRRDQTASALASSAARKACEIAATRQASSGALQASVADRASRRAI